MGRKTLKLPEELFTRLSDDKPESMTWPAYFETRCLDAGAFEMDVPADVREQLDRIEAAANEATNAAQNAESSADDLKGAMGR